MKLWIYASDTIQTDLHPSSVYKTLLQMSHLPYLPHDSCATPYVDVSHTSPTIHHYIHDKFVVHIKLFSPHLISCPIYFVLNSCCMCLFSLSFLFVLCKIIICCSCIVCPARVFFCYLFIVLQFRFLSFFCGFAYFFLPHVFVCVFG